MLSVQRTAPVTRDWKNFLTSGRAGFDLNFDIDQAVRIVHSTVCNGKRVDCSYTRDRDDYQVGSDLARHLIRFFFSNVFKDLGHFKQHPEMIHRFQDIGTGWKFHLNDEDYMEVHLV